MIVGGSPSLVRLDHCGRLGTELADVGYRAIRLNIERHAYRVGRALVELCAFHVLALPRIGWHEMRLFECEIAHWEKNYASRAPNGSCCKTRSDPQAETPVPLDAADALPRPPFSIGASGCQSQDQTPRGLPR
jgi:hypothetical protein